MGKADPHLPAVEAVLRIVVAVAIRKRRARNSGKGSRLGWREKGTSRINVFK
jgi:hypothetical protein